MKIKIGDILIYKAHDIAVKVTEINKTCSCGKNCLNLATTKNSNWGSISDKNLQEFNLATPRNIKQSSFAIDLAKDIKKLNEKYP